MANPIVHVIGTGTIGEPLIGLLAAFKEPLGISEITFHKRTPLLTDRSKVTAALKRGAKRVHRGIQRAVGRQFCLHTGFLSIKPQRSRRAFRGDQLQYDRVDVQA